MIIYKMRMNLSHQEKKFNDVLYPDRAGLSYET